MPRSNRFLVVVLCVTVVAFAVGLTKLFLWRFEAGDVYPPYSSLRADPLGTKALYDSLSLLPSVAVDRNYRPMAKLLEERPATLLFLGGSLSLPTEDVETLEAMARQGDRVVIALPPTQQQRPAPDKNKKKPPEKPDEKEPEPAVPLVQSLATRWKCTVDYVRLPERTDKHSPPGEAQRAGTETLPESIPWHTTLVFTNLDAAWRVVYARDHCPVIIERPFGRGSVVVASDCYLLSNEALWRDRHPALLGWIIGANHHVIFEETHFGIGENPGIAALIRRYRLHGLFAALLVVAGLFVWKNAIPFVPPYTEEVFDGGDPVAGRDSATGFVNLLRRSIPRHEILNVCFAEWKKAFVSLRGDKLERMQEVVAAQNDLPARQRTPTATYRALSRILAERK